MILYADQTIKDTSLTIALLYIIGNYYFCMLIFKVVNEIHNFFD